MGEEMKFCEHVVGIIFLLTLLTLSLSILTTPVLAQSDENAKTVTVVVTFTSTLIPPLGSIGVWFGLGFVAGVIVMGIVVVLRSEASTSSKRGGKKRR